MDGDNACVEVRLGGDGVEIRNSRHPDGPVLSFDPEVWQAFLDRVKQDGFDDPRAV